MTGFRTQILRQISVLADTDKYPQSIRFVSGDCDPRYAVQILPRGEKPTRIPHHLLSTLKSNFMFSIRVRITQLPPSDDVMIVSGPNDSSDDVQIIREEKTPPDINAAPMLVNLLLVLPVLVQDIQFVFHCNYLYDYSLYMYMIHSSKGFVL